MNIDQIIESASKREDKALGTRLRVGDIVKTSGQEHLVWFVNDCRASLLPLLKDRVAFEDGTTGKQVSFQAHAKMISISPDAEVEVLQRLGKTGMIQFLENQKQQRKEMKTKDKTAKTEKTNEAPKLGKLGGFLGYSLTSVIRAMGKAGWAYWEARNVLESEKIPAAENTIRIQLSAGSRGQGGDPAPVDGELKKLRPDESEKPARATSEKPAKAKKANKKASKQDKKADKAAKSKKAAIEAEEAGDSKKARKAKKAAVRAEVEEDSDPDVE